MRGYCFWARFRTLRTIMCAMNFAEAELRSRISALRWDSAPSFEQYLVEVEAARRLGYAVDNGQYVRGVTTASAAILDSAGRPHMAISAVGFSAQFDADALRVLGEDLRDRAAAITRMLSGAAAAA